MTPCKACRKCGELKPLDAFSVRSWASDGRRPWCRGCNTEYQRARRAADPERARADDRRYDSRRDRRGRPRPRRERAVYHAIYGAIYSIARHGITPEEFTAMLAAQGGGCGICGTTDPGRRSRFSIDHDHEHHPGGYGCPICIRGGVLCQPCNVRLGNAENHNDTAYLSSPAVMLYLARYVVPPQQLERQAS